MSLVAGGAQSSSSARRSFLSSRRPGVLRSAVTDALPKFSRANATPNALITAGRGDGNRRSCRQVRRKASEACRTPRRFARQGAARNSARFWSAAALCRFSPRRPRMPGTPSRPERILTSPTERRIYPAFRLVWAPASAGASRGAQLPLDRRHILDAVVRLDYRLRLAERRVS